jgi:hypothetical protein
MNAQDLLTSYFFRFLGFQIFRLDKRSSQARRRNPTELMGNIGDNNLEMREENSLKQSPSFMFTD